MRYRINRDCTPPQNLTQRETAELTDRLGMPLLYISGMVPDAGYLVNLETRNSFRHTMEVARGKVIEIATLYGVDEETLLNACDLYFASKQLLKELGPFLENLLPQIAKDVFEPELGSKH